MNRFERFIDQHMVAIWAVCGLIIGICMVIMLVCVVIVVSR